jgi:hypothetical protein
MNNIHLKLMTNTNTGKIKVFCADNFNRFYFIGIINPGGRTLRVYDNDNFDSSNKALAIPEEVLISPALDFNRIDIKYNHKVWSTTRQFFLTFSRKAALYDGREQMSLPVKCFGWHTALLYQDYLRYRDLANKPTIVEAFPKGWGPLDFTKWQQAQHLQTDWASRYQSIKPYLEGHSNGYRKSTRQA